MKPRKPLPRSTKPIARSPIKKKKRPKEDTERIYGPAERRAWVCSLPSVISGKGPCQNCHTAGDGGMGYKASARFIVPMTAAEHAEWHRIGTASFEQKYGIDLAKTAERIEAMWQTIVCA